MLKSRLASDVCCLYGKGQIWNKFYGKFNEKGLKKINQKVLKIRPFGLLQNKRSYFFKLLLKLILK